MNYKQDLKKRIPEGILQFCEVCIIDKNMRVLRWNTVSPTENLLDIVYDGNNASNQAIKFLGILNDQDISLREARVTLIFQNENATSSQLAETTYPTTFDEIGKYLLHLDPLLPILERNLERDTSGIEYWRRCRKYIGHDHLFVPAAGAFVTDGKGRYLLQRRRDDSTWGILGGGTEIGESVVATASREVLEEAGLHVRIVRLLSIATGDDCILDYPNGDKGKFWGFLFLAEVIGGTVVESNEETLELDWFTYQEIEDLEGKSLYLAHNFKNIKNIDLRIHAETIEKVV